MFRQAGALPRVLFALLTIAFAAAASPPVTIAGAGAANAAEVNVYSYRQEFLMRPFLDAFTADTGIEVNVVFAQTGLLERLRAEGANSPADLVLTVDISRLDALVQADLLRPVKSAALERNIPAQFRHPTGLWFGLTQRARIVYYAKDRVNTADLPSYEDLASATWRGKVCMRSGKHVYNRGLVASMIAAHGEAKAAIWLAGLAENQARRPQGSDRSQVKAIMEGVCDVALGNHYYYGKMKFNDKQPEQKAWAAAVGLHFPNQDGRGTHVNISGVALTKAAKNTAAAVRLMEYLAGDKAQHMYAAVNYEYPVKPGVKWDTEVKSWGTFKADTVSLQTIADNAGLAQKLIDRAGLD